MNRMMIFPVTVATVAALCVAALGATITDLGPWYQGLEKPGWNPPDVVFPMGWTLIYALITISGITAWRAAPTAAKSEWVLMLFALNGFSQHHLEPDLLPHAAPRLGLCRTDPAVALDSCADHLLRAVFADRSGAAGALPCVGEFRRRAQLGGRAA